MIFKIPGKYKVKLILLLLLLLLLLLVLSPYPEGDCTDNWNYYGAVLEHGLTLRFGRGHRNFIPDQRNCDVAEIDAMIYGGHCFIRCIGRQARSTYRLMWTLIVSQVAPDSFRRPASIRSILELSRPTGGA